MDSGYLKDLSRVQRQAVEDCMGPSLIIAGAGSGKTRVLTCRIACLIEQGVAPWQVLALTFTNKAAREMRERISEMVDQEKANRLWMGTFHSIFARILRNEAQHIGLPAHFTIYDKSDSKSALKACIKELQLDEKRYPLNEVQGRISKAKNNLADAHAYASQSGYTADDRANGKPHVVDIYRLYAQKCRLSNALDFDDLLLYTYVLFRDFPDVLQKYSTRFTHILVDEYQDTNYAQYLILKQLALGHRNLCVVGDDAQSIYAFRGARIENILNFKRDFPEAKEYKLEQNYRSTQTIVQAANSVIQHNVEQLKKECFSQGERGELIELLKAFTDHDEAFSVVSSMVTRQYASAASFNDFAILYRTNAQSRSLEEALRKRNIPYKIFSGFSFYERAEIKDMLAYLRLLVNPQDDEAFRRVINVPARGIGDTTLLRLQTAASVRQTSIWEQIEGGDLSEFGLKPSALNKLKEFVSLITEIAIKQYDTNAYDLAAEIAHRSGYIEALKSDSSMEGKARVENVEELLNGIKEFTDPDAEAEGVDESSVTIHAYLTNVALITDLEEQDNKQEQKVSLMTIHAAKGLEFNYVYIVGLEENLFPSLKSVNIQKELEEERRLFYVALTRAKSALTLSYAQKRYKWGKLEGNPPSRFIREIAPQWLNMKTSPTRPVSFRPPSMTSPALRKLPATLPPRPVHPDFVSDNPLPFKTGQKVEHERFGLGEILSLEGDSLGNWKAVVRFDVGGAKTLLLKYAKMKIVGGN